MSPISLEITVRPAAELAHLKTPGSKNRLSFDQWPAGYFFPTYCGGPCKLVSSNALLKITSVINQSLAEEFPLEDVLFSGIFRTLANVTNIQHKRGLCEHADREYEDPAKHLFSGLLNIYFNHGFRNFTEVDTGPVLSGMSGFTSNVRNPFPGGLKQMEASQKNSFEINFEIIQR